MYSISSTRKSDDPVKNQIAAALVDRILLAARNGEKFKVNRCAQCLVSLLSDTLFDRWSLLFLRFLVSQAQVRDNHRIRRRIIAHKRRQSRMRRLYEPSWLRSIGPSTVADIAYTKTLRKLGMNRKWHLPPVVLVVFAQRTCQPGLYSLLSSARIRSYQCTIW